MAFVFKNCYSLKLLVRLIYGRGFDQFDTRENTVNYNKIFLACREQKLKKRFFKNIKFSAERSVKKDKKGTKITIV